MQERALPGALVTHDTELGEGELALADVADTRQRIERVHVAGVPHRKGASVAIVSQLANRDTDDREMDRLKFLRDLAAAKV